MTPARIAAFAVFLWILAPGWAAAGISDRAIDWLAGDYGILLAGISPDWQQHSEESLGASPMQPGIDRLIRFDNASTDAAHRGVWVGVSIFDRDKLQPFQAARTVLYTEYKIDPSKDSVAFSDPRKVKAASGEEFVVYAARMRWRTASGGWSDQRYAALAVLDHLPEARRGLVLVGGVDEQAAGDTQPDGIVIEDWVTKLKLEAR